MVTAVNDTRAAATRPAPRTRPSGWVLRSLTAAHLLAIVGQPVFAGVYLSGDFDGLRLHALGADVVFYIGIAQLIAAIVVWVRLGLAWPFAASLVVLAAETVQYLAGMEGALWLHLPLGVLTVAGIALLFVAVWRRPLARPVKPEAGDE
ncbi:hypothetical protein [Phytomonospora endophytica]|uniref:Uncharacterized protein n=1 Tax=Phytomonospora endophytica TaxID=714109 RepID=A0A841FH11_9ACTN|nr:hypothetical protein [Phytomonospora endophytica]MBB6034283.1 hypothetical protein [Phytomonospora endophytica]GIG66676.1 hypothetical protein Pen01_29710 [Phytomonospora endophytica]